MRVTHKFSLVCRCPVNNDVDYYECEVTVTRLVKCEDVLTAVNNYTGDTVFQEQLTQALADDLGADVVTRGMHVGGKVETTCRCEPSERS